MYKFIFKFLNIAQAFLKVWVVFFSFSVFSITENKDTEKLNEVLKNYNENTERVENDLRKLEEDTSSMTEDSSGELVESSTSTTGSDSTNTDDLENQLNDFQNSVNTLAGSVSPGTKEEKTTDEKNAVKLDYKDNPELSKNIGFMLEPLRKLPDNELKKNLEDKIEDSKFGFIFEQFPKLYDLLVNLVKDKEALPSLVKISERRDKLSTLAWLMLGSIIVGFLIKKLLYDKQRPFFVALIIGLCRMTFMMGLRFSIFWYIFREELSPSIKVMLSTFLTT